MGFASGQNNNGRAIGYGIDAVCDFEGCDHQIDRGVGYCCGGIDGTGNAGMEDEPYCGGFFCDEHLEYLPLAYAKEGITVCETCHERQVCPKCDGEAIVGDDEEECDLCGTFGYVAQSDGKAVEAV